MRCNTQVLGGQGEAAPSLPRLSPAQETLGCAAVPLTCGTCTASGVGTLQSPTAPTSSSTGHLRAGLAQGKAHGTWQACGTQEAHPRDRWSCCVPISHTGPLAHALLCPALPYHHQSHTSSPPLLATLHLRLQAAVAFLGKCRESAGCGYALVGLTGSPLLPQGKCMATVRGGEQGGTGHPFLHLPAQGWQCHLCPGECHPDTQTVYTQLLQGALFAAPSW